MLINLLEYLDGVPRGSGEFRTIRSMLKIVGFVGVHVNRERGD